MPTWYTFLVINDRIIRRIDGRQHWTVAAAEIKARRETPEPVKSVTVLKCVVNSPDHIAKGILNGTLAETTKVIFTTRKGGTDEQA